MGVGTVQLICRVISFSELQNWFEWEEMVSVSSWHHVTGPFLFSFLPVSRVGGFLHLSINVCFLLSILYQHAFSFHPYIGFCIPLIDVM